MASLSLAIPPCNFLLLDIRSDAQRSHVVSMEKIVSDVELVKCEGNFEFGECGRFIRCSEKGYDKIWSVAVSIDGQYAGIWKVYIQKHLFFSHVKMWF